MSAMLRRNPTLSVFAIVLVLVGAGIAWWLGSPLFLSQTVNDAPIVSNAGTSNQPTSVKAGTFRNGDDFHRGSGRTVIYQLPDGKRRLQLEDFNVTNGPDLFVVLTSATDPATSSEVHADGYIELSRLKGNSGNQVYELPADLDLNNANSVVIYCRAFSVVFSVAPLEIVGG
jgi:hypothetical protein